jgi:hypothetical protein
MRNFQKIFKAVPKIHKQNDGLWLTAIDPSETELEELTVIQERNSCSVAMWVGVSWQGKAKPVIFTGNMDKAFYKNDILKGSVIPYMRKQRSTKCFQQDGDPKHTAKAVKDYLTVELSEKGWTYPPPSPCKKPTKKP